MKLSVQSSARIERVFTSFSSMTLGVLTSIIAFLIDVSAPQSLLLGLMVTSITIGLRIHSLLIDEGVTLGRKIRSNNVLSGYSDCIEIYDQVIIKLKVPTNKDTGKLLHQWLNEMIKTHQSQYIDNWRLGRMTFRADEVEDRGIEVQQTVKNGFAVQLERNVEFWSSADAYIIDSRTKAQLSVEITRVFLLKNESSLENSEIRQQILADHGSKINVLVAYTDNPGKNQVTDKNAIKDFGIWDDALLCTMDINPQTQDVTGCTYSIDETDLTNARRRKNHIISRAFNPIELLKKDYPAEININ